MVARQELFLQDALLCCNCAAVSLEITSSMFLSDMFRNLAQGPLTTDGSTRAGHSECSALPISTANIGPSLHHCGIVAFVQDVAADKKPFRRWVKSRLRNLQHPWQAEQATELETCSRQVQKESPARTLIVRARTTFSFCACLCPALWAWLSKVSLAT